MKSALLSLFLLLFLAPDAAAGGGIWVLELSYIEDGRQRTCYLLADYWANDFEHFIGRDSLFRVEFHERFGDSGNISVYQKIEDNEALAKAVSFPMHPFHLVQGSEMSIRIETMTHLALVKVWKKSDYMVTVLSPISMEDSTWASGASTVSYPVGQDVGCRLEVHDFRAQQEHKALLQEFVSMYQVKDADPDGFEERSASILEELKKNKVVIVELCGC